MTSISKNKNNYNSSNNNLTNKYNQNKRANHQFKKIIKDDKLKPIRPTLREKKRFVKIKIESNIKFDFKEISEKINEKIMYYIGAIDFGKGGVRILKDKFDKENQILILKVGTKQKDKLIGAISLIKNINKDDVKLKIITISGTLKGTN